MSSFSPIAQSLLHFYTCKYESSLHQINLNFVQMGKAPIIEVDLDLYEIYQYPFAKWEYFFQRYLNFHWTGNVRLLEIYDEIFLHAPFRRFPSFVSQLHLPYFSETNRAQKDYFPSSSNIELEEKRIEELSTLLEKVCSTGFVLESNVNESYGVFPIIDEDFFALLERFQGNLKYKSMIKEAITSGLEKAENMSREQVADEHFETISKIFFQEWCLPPSCIPFKEGFLPRFAKQFPDRKELVLLSLKNYQRNVKSEQELFDFMHIFSGGEASPIAPTESFSQVIRLLERN